MSRQQQQQQQSTPSRPPNTLTQQQLINDTIQRTLNLNPNLFNPNLGRSNPNEPPLNHQELLNSILGSLDQSKNSNNMNNNNNNNNQGGRKPSLLSGYHNPFSSPERAMDMPMNSLGLPNPSNFGLGPLNQSGPQNPRFYIPHQQQMSTQSPHPILQSNNPMSQPPSSSSQANIAATVAAVLASSQNGPGPNNNNINNNVGSSSNNPLYNPTTSAAAAAVIAAASSLMSSFGPNNPTSSQNNSVSLSNTVTVTSKPKNISQPHMGLPHSMSNNNNTPNNSNNNSNTSSLPFSPAIIARVAADLNAMGITPSHPQYSQYIQQQFQLYTNAGANGGGALGPHFGPSNSTQPQTPQKQTEPIVKKEPPTPQPPPSILLSSHHNSHTQMFNHQNPFPPPPTLSVPNSLLSSQHSLPPPPPTIHQHHHNQLLHSNTNNNSTNNHFNRANAGFTSSTGMPSSNNTCISSNFTSISSSSSSYVPQVEAISPTPEDQKENSNLQALKEKIIGEIEKVEKDFASTQYQIDMLKKKQVKFS
jgi:hypothetical protein